MAQFTGTSGADSITGIGSVGFTAAGAASASGLNPLGIDVVFGEDGNDTVIAGSVNPGQIVVFGGAGNDSIVGATSPSFGTGSVLYGDAGDDTVVAAMFASGQLLNGGQGNDSLVGSAGSDILLGDVGNDTIEGGVGSDNIDGGSGNNSISGGADGDEITASFGNDVIFGDAGNDTIMAGDGANTISGGADSDRIVAGNGADSIDGGDFGDHIDAGNGANTILGGGGGDRIFAGSDSDLIIGGGADSTDGGDYIDAHRGDNTVFGGSGNDDIFASFGSDSVDGGDGNDWMEVGSGNNTVLAGAGVDNIFAAYGNDSLDGGADNDRIEAGEGNNTVLGGEGVEDIYAGFGNDCIDGGNGNDNIFAGNGANTISGGGGTDFIFAGFGADSIDGGDGDDFIDAGTNANTVIGGIGNDNIYSGGSNDSLSGGAGNDSFIAASGADTVGGDDGNDFIDAGENGDSLNGGTGNDSVLGGGGGDTLVGGRGNDRYDGGAETDTLDYTNAGVDRIVVNAANQRVVKTIGGVTELDRIQNIESYVGTGGNDRFNGGGFDESFTGGAGNDTINAGSGFDTARYDVQGAGNVSVNLLTGIAQDGLGGVDRIAKASATNSFIETVIAGGGSDTLVGDADGNWLRGGAGADSIDGGEGGDHADYSGDADANLDGFGIAANLSAGAITVSGAFGGSVAAGQVRDASGALDTLANIENLRGTGFADLLVGSADNNNFRGMRGADTMQGGLGYDVANYRSDADGNLITSGASTIEAVGGPNDEFGVIVNLSGAAVTVAGFGNEGSISVGARTGRDGWGNLDQLSGIEGATGSLFNDFLVGRERTLLFSVGESSFYGEDRAQLRGLMGADTMQAGAIGDGTLVNYAEDVGAVKVDLANGTAEDGWGFTDRLVNITAASGSDFDDTIIAASTGSLMIGRLGDDLLQGGAARDSVSFGSAAAGAYAVLDAGTVPGSAQDGDGGSDTLLNIENLSGSAFADTLVGNAEDNVFFGGRGADSMDGGSGRDLLSYYGSWQTYATEDLSSVTGVNVNLLTGVASDGDTTPGGGSIDRIANFEDVVGTHFADTLGGNTLANSLVGAEGDDSILGAGGADTLLGGEGNDVLLGQGGADRINGGNGIDTASYATATTGVTVSLLITGAQAGTGEALGDVLISIENLIGSNVVDQLTGSSLANLIQGLNGADRIGGGGGADTLQGGNGADSLAGNLAADLLVGGGGADTLTGGGTGNTDADLFRFDAVSEAGDVITDFGTGADRIQLTAAGFTGLTAGGSAAAFTGGFLVFGGGKLSYDADGTGGSTTLVTLATFIGSVTVGATEVQIL